MKLVIGSTPSYLLPVHVSRPMGQPFAALFSAAAQHSTAQLESGLQHYC